MSNKYKHGKYRISIAGDKNIQNKVVSITDNEGNDVLGGGSGSSSPTILAVDSIENLTDAQLSVLKAGDIVKESAQGFGPTGDPLNGTAYVVTNKGDDYCMLTSVMDDHRVFSAEYVKEGGQWTCTNKETDIASTPFKGWYKSFDELKAAHLAKEGDSAYVKDASPATTWSIYVFDETAYSNNYWADSDTDVDTTYVQTFASGEEVNETYIDDTHLSDAESDSLTKAGDAQLLAQKIAPIKMTETKVDLSLATIKNGYVYNGNRWESPKIYINSTTNDTKHVIINVEGYDRVRFLGKLNTSNLVQGWAFYNSSNKSGSTFLNSNVGYIGFGNYDYNTNLVEYQLKEYVVDVPADAKYFKTCVKYMDGALQENNFYCYLQKGDNVDTFVNGPHKPGWAEQEVEIVSQTNKLLPYWIPSGTKIKSLTLNGAETTLTGIKESENTEIIGANVTTTKDIKLIVKGESGTVKIVCYYGVTLEDRVSNLESEVSTVNDVLSSQSPSIVVPSDIYAIIGAGDNLQIFKRSIIKAVDPNQYHFEVSCAKGKVYERYYEYAPKSGDEGNYPMTFMLKDNSGNIIATANSTLHVVSPTEPQSLKNVLVIGASTYQDGNITKELVRRITTDSGSASTPSNPLGINWSNVAFVGRKEVTVGGTTIHQEATGGYGWRIYSTNALKSIRVYLTQEGHDSISLGAQYKITGVSQTTKYPLIAIEIGETTDILFETGSYTYSENQIPASGELVKVSGTGDSPLVYSSRVLESGNPFWDSSANDGAGGISFAHYSQEYLNGSEINAIVMAMGINDFHTISGLVNGFHYVTDFLDAYKNYITDNNIEGKAFVGGMQLQDLRFPFNAQRGNFYDYYETKLVYLKYNEMINELVKDPEYSFVKIMDTTSEFDGEYAFGMVDKTVDNRIAINEKVGNNAAHPTTNGKMMIADSIFRAIVGIGL